MTPPPSPPPQQQQPPLPQQQNSTTTTGSSSSSSSSTQQELQDESSAIVTTTSPLLLLNGGDTTHNNHNNSPTGSTSSTDDATTTTTPTTIKTKTHTTWTIRRIVTIVLFLLLIVLQYCVYLLQQQITTVQQQQQSSSSSLSGITTTTTTTSHRIKKKNDDDNDDNNEEQHSQDSNHSIAVGAIIATSSSISSNSLEGESLLLDWDNHYYDHHQQQEQQQIYDNTYTTTSRPYTNKNTTTTTTSSSSSSKDIYWQQLIFGPTSFIFDTDLLYSIKHFGGRTTTSTTGSTGRNQDNDDDNNNDKSQQQQQQPEPEPSALPLPLQQSQNAISLLHHTAIHQGHSTAQYLLANAYMTGFYYYSNVLPSNYNNNNNHNNHHHHSSHPQPENQQPPIVLHVMDDWWYVPPVVLADSVVVTGVVERQQRKRQEQQQAQGMLLYQMAAIGGNVDAMITLGHRIEEQQQSSSTTTTTKISASTSQCQRSLPYFASAAHHIIDTLMNDMYSRGQIMPYQDRHTLYKIHVHGGNYPVPTSTSNTMSLNDMDSNKPYESMETIQFYKIKASALLQQQQNDLHRNEQSASIFSIRQWWKRTKPGTDVNTNNQDATATAAAYTLGRIYHIGARGISPNSTIAIQYYTAAANAGHWEAAGQAGFLRFYNVGFDVTTATSAATTTTTTTTTTASEKNNVLMKNREEAYRLFLLGAPFQLNGCQLRYQQKLQQAQQKLTGNPNPNHDRIFLCDSESLNGLGLIYLFGLPTKNITIHIPIATRYFELARDQGNANAAYNLAMMKLGWRTHYNTNNPNNRSTTEDTATDASASGVLDVDNGINNEQLTTLARKEAEQLFPLISSKDNGTNKNQNDGRYLSVLEYKTILTDLTSAAKSGHLLARHRLAMIYENGILTPPDSDMSKKDSKKSQPQKYILAPDCESATVHYKWIIEHASPMKAQRMRKAYQHYMAGNYVDSLRYYLYVADMGHEIAQLNAAFLLELGVCLGLNDVDCAKASVRLWKVVANRDHAEANMRVGDFYYYGRFRTLQDRDGGGSNSIPVGPWGWIDYIIYPEKHLLSLLWNEIKRQIINFSLWEPLSILDVSSLSSESQQDIHNAEPTCTEDNIEGACSAVEGHSDNDGGIQRRRQQQLDEDLTMAAHYYQLAADRTGTARAHFNLGFMYEWGLGLKQDFPLAKRQYDLAMTSSGQDHEANLPIVIALSAMNVHEYFVKLRLSWDKYWQRNDVDVASLEAKEAKVEL